ncbi:hypothetical protein ABPG75_006413 [Micractinium tetrahymenae]
MLRQSRAPRLPAHPRCCSHLALAAAPSRLRAPLQLVQPPQRLLQRRARLHCTAVAEPTVKMGGGRKRGGGGRRGGPAGQPHQPPAQQQHYVQTLLEQQAALAEAQLEQPAPASPARQHTAAPPLPPPNADLLPIAFADGKVTVGDGLVLLDRISPQARQPHREAGGAASDMVLLSFAASKGATCMEDFALGTLHCKQWLCCARNKLWWMTPEWGKSGRDLPPETQFLLAELEDGSYASVLPLISQDTFRGTLRPPR